MNQWKHDLYALLLALLPLHAAISLAAGNNAKADCSGVIMVSAAISLKDALSEAAGAFMRLHPNSKVDLNFAASGQLKVQIENDAPVDVFVSASASDMDSLAAKGKILKETSVTIARNELVFIMHRDAKRPVATLDELKDSSFKSIALGSVESVPAGRYARQSLEFYHLWDDVKSRLVFGANVRQVLDYVARGEVDGGFVYASDVKTDSRVRAVIRIANAAHEPIVYPAAVVKSSENKATAQEFIAYMVGLKGGATLKKYGFIRE